MWLVWNGTYWQPDTTGEIFRRGKDTVRAITEEISSDMDADTKKAIRSHAKQSESKAKLTAMIELAKHEPGVVIKQSGLDANEMLLGVLNGVIDLRFGQHHPPRREDLNTKQARVNFDALAQCPQWKEFLSTTFAGSDPMLAYIQRVVGYLLTGNVSERVMFILFGNGANGKSTFLEVLRALLNDYALQTPAETLMSSGRVNRGIPNDIARLAGARLVSSSETEEGAPLAESTVKHLTGGDVITARYLFSEFFEIIPTFKFMLASNYPPVIRGVDPAIWTRLLMIPFAVSIPKDKQDRNLRDKLLAELPGILNWAVEGCLEWQRVGLQPPPEVLNATDDYKAGQNQVAAWVDERCTAKEGLRSQASVLYRDYRGWMEQQSEKPLTQRRFGERLKALGFEKIKSGNFHYLGLTLGTTSSGAKFTCAPDLDLDGWMD